MTIEELGRNYKQTYGDDKALVRKSDLEVGQQVLAKHPEYWQHIGFQPSGERFEPGRKILAKFGARREAYQTEALRTELEQEDIAAHGIDRNRLRFAEEVHRHQVTLETHKLGLEAQTYQTQVLKTVSEIAMKRGLSLVAYDQIRIDEENKRNDVWYKYLLNEMEIDKKQKDKNIDVAGAMRYNLMEKERVLFMKESILTLLEQQHTILADQKKAEPLRIAQAAVVEEVITGFKETLRGYLQNVDGENIRGSDPGSKHRPDDTEDVPEDEEQLPPKDTGAKRD